MFTTPISLEEEVIKKLSDELAPTITKTVQSSIQCVTPEELQKFKKQFYITEYKTEEVGHKLANFEKELMLK
jgi:hypothetical protein